MEIAIDLGGFAQFESLWRRAPELADRELHAAMEESLMLLQRETVEATPTGAYGLLRQSIIAREPQRLADGLIGVVDVDDARGRFGSVLNYAVAIELGTRPHFPPIEPLIDWVRAKLGVERDDAPGVAYRVARKIATSGTEGAHMFERTLQAQRTQVLRIFEAALRRLTTRLASY